MRKKKMSPAVLVLLLIVLVILAGILYMFVSRYIPSSEKMDSREYFGNPEEGEFAVVVDEQLTDAKGMIIDGNVYLSDQTVSQYVNSRFYWDNNEKKMIYTLPEESIEFQVDSNEYSTAEGTVQEDFPIIKANGEDFYLALSFIEQYTDMVYETYKDPDRIVIFTGQKEKQQTTTTKSGEVRQKGGIKSKIVTKVDAGQEVFILEEMENWSKVETMDGYIGYIQKKKLGQPEAAKWTSEKKQPEYTSIQKDYKINMAWHQVTGMDANNTLEDTISGATGLNTISPTWFSLADEEGNITSLASKSYVDQAHRAGLEVWGLLDNFNPDMKTINVLSYTSKREKIIQGLLKEAKAVGLDGINVDLESITEETGPHYVQFLRELSIVCRKEGLVLSVDNPVPEAYNMYYNRKEQGIVADYVIIMGYDEHYKGDPEAGSVASKDFVKAGIEKTLEEVPKEKVVNGIPFYTRVWASPYSSSNVNSEVLGMDGADNYVKEHGMEVIWDESVGQNVARLEAEDALYQIWLEDEDSIEVKMQMIKEYELAGVAQWKLGFERDNVWEVIENYLQ